MQTLKSKLILAAVFAAAISQAPAAAVRAGFSSTSFPGNDDGSVVPAVSLGGMAIDFYALTGVTSVWVNNNGNVTFGGPLGTYTPFGITGGSLPMLAPFFADVDTRVGTVVTYGTGSVDGHDAFGVNWVDVGYYAGHTDKTNSFQLVIVDRSDIASGDFDFEFNYDRIEWETGDASGGSGGLGGVSAHAGWTDGAGTYLELPGSGVNGGLLDSNGATGLVHNSINSPVDGRYEFRVRGGHVDPIPTPDSGTTLGMLSLALAGLMAYKKKRVS